MKTLKRVYIWMVLLFLYAPIGVLMFYSFNASRSRGKWTGFSFDWYLELFNDPLIAETLYNTLLVGVVSAVVATIIGTFAAVGIHVMGKYTKKLILNVTNIPVLNPDIVTGISLMILYIFVFRMFNFGSLGLGTLLLSHITFNIPYVILSVLPRLSRLNKNLYESALDLGATPSYAFYKVILPELMPGVITGLILAFTLSIDDFVISFFSVGPGVSNLSIYIYSMARRGINPKINALSTILFIVVLALLFFINKRSKKESMTYENY